MEEQLKEILNHHSRENKLNLVSILEEMNSKDLSLTLPRAIVLSKHTGSSVSDIYALCKTTFARILENRRYSDFEICCGSNCYLGIARKFLQKLQLPSNALSYAIEHPSNIKMSIKKCNGKCNDSYAVSISIKAQQKDMLNSIINREINHDL